MKWCFVLKKSNKFSKMICSKIIIQRNLAIEIFIDEFDLKCFLKMLQFTKSFHYNRVAL